MSEKKSANYYASGQYMRDRLKAALEEYKKNNPPKSLAQLHAEAQQDLQNVHNELAPVWDKSNSAFLAQLGVTEKTLQRTLGLSNRHMDALMGRIL